MTDEVLETTVEPTGQEAELAPQVENSTEPTTVQEVEQPAEQKPNRIPDSVQRRINELTRQKHEAQRQNDELRHQVEQLRQGDQTQPQQTAQDPQQIAQQIVQRQNFDAACNRVYEQGKAQFSDFDSAVANLSVLGVQPEFLEAVTSMDNPHGILYALAADLDDAARIMSLPPVLQGRELERLSIKAAAPASAPVSKAPAPITPVDGSASVNTDPEKMTTEEWMAWRKQNIGSKRK